MAQIMTPLARKFRQFLDDEGGVLLVEFLLFMPLLIWTLLSIFVYWDAFRLMNLNQKAAYTIADLISRQEADITPAFVEGMDDIFNFLTQGAPGAKIRISSVQWDGDENEYVLLFSESPGDTMTPHTDATLEDISSRIPEMSNLDSVVIVETMVDYNPRFDTGVLNLTGTLDDQSYYQIIVTRPRFTLRVCMTDPVCPTV